MRMNSVCLLWLVCLEVESRGQRSLSAGKQDKSVSGSFVGREEGTVFTVHRGDGMSVATHKAPCGQDS